MTQYWITLKNVGNDGKIVVEFNENEVISEYFVAGETEMHHSVNITNEIEAIIQNAEQVERRNALAEGADGRHDCLQSTQPKYTREELVEIMCRANADLSPVGSDALVYLSMDDCATGTQSPNWHRDLHKMHTALSALEQAGALQVRQTEIHDEPGLQGKI